MNADQCITICVNKSVNISVSVCVNVFTYSMCVGTHRNI